MGEFVRTKVLPEVDAYTLSKLCEIASQNNNIISLDDGETIEENCMKLINKAINSINEITGYEEEVVVFVNPKVYSALMNTPEISHQLMVSDFSKGEISTKVLKLNNASIIPVPTARMKTVYEFLTDGEGGFVAGEEAQDIGIIALPKKAASLVKKTEKIRVFNPDQNTAMDAYKFDYRLYYDTFVKNSAKNTIFAYIY